MLLIPLWAAAQAEQTIRGQVCDVASGEPMMGVTIQVEDETAKAAVTDVGGNP